jgi:hypothetical protein
LANLCGMAPIERRSFVVVIETAAARASMAVST